MKKIYSIVLMAAALLVGTNAWAANVAKIGSQEYETFEKAWRAAQDGDVIELLANDVTVDSTLWLGTANMEDEGKSLTLDLGGYNLIGNTAKASRMFYITHGSLLVQNGTITQNGDPSSDSQFEIFRLTGSTYKTVNPKTAASGYYTSLTIAADVTLNARANAIVLDRVSGWPSNVVKKTTVGTVAVPTAGVTKPATFAYNTNIYSSSRGSVYGVRLDVYGKLNGVKYAIKANGNIGSPISSDHVKPTGSYKSSPSDQSGYYEVLAADADYTPYIYLHNGSKIFTAAEATGSSTKQPVAAYSGGYCRWLIEGHCKGGTGVYIKSGEVDINNAIVESNYTGTFMPATNPKGSGVTGCGSAIVIESNASYAGDIDVAISGNTQVTATNGYAIEENVTNAKSSEVEAIEILGGTFNGGNVAAAGEPAKEGTIKISETTADNAASEIIITGGNISGTVDGVEIGNQNLAQFLNSQTAETHYEITGEGENVQIVISQGDAPAGEANIEGHAATAEIRWTGGATPYTLANDVTLKELVINEAYAQTLTVPAGKVLTVDRVVLGSSAQIIVEAGAKMFVLGAQGINAQKAENLVLKTQEGNPAYLLFGPNVQSNSHPSATVEFISKGFGTSASNYFYQRFGIPTISALTSITAKNPDTQAPVETSFAAWINKSWTTIGYIHSSKAALDYSKMANPFEYYQMLHNTPNMGTVVTMKGALVGNENPNLTLLGDGNYSMFANSYTGTMNAEQVIDMIPVTAQKAFYLYDITANQATWKSVTLDFAENIAPMQPFIIYNDKESAVGQLDYNSAVYVPATTSAAPARKASNITKAQIIVKGEDCIDRVGVVEGEEFSADFDNGHEAVKYMNEGINMYVSADQKMAVAATNDLNNTYIGFQTVNGGNYTIEFANVNGQELMLIDHETDARIAMVEGNVYEFTAAANTTNDYRFEVVRMDKVATAIGNVDAAKSAKGIYTITGQYVGEMNVWNALPAGVYVVNGEKRVK
jgi:hypothetical protein